MNKQWWKESVVYQIYPRSFCDSNGDGIGDIRGIIGKLDYLQHLGIDVIWLSPVYESPNDDNGYDISDYRNIMKEFGSMEDFHEMLEESHKRNIKIMMDLVVNHSSDEHAWFMESRSSKDNPKRDYYIWRKGKENGEPPNNWGGCFGGSAWEYDETTGEYYLHLFSKKQPDLNWEHEPLRKEVYNLMNFWLDKGVDGFRMDVVNFISKRDGLPDGPQGEGQPYGDGGVHFVNGPKIHDYLQEMNARTFSRYDTITVGEMPGAHVEEAKLYTGEQRNELNMVFHFEHVDIGNGHFGKWNPQGWGLPHLKSIFERWQVGLEQDGWNSLYWSNHDQPRAVSRWIDTKGNENYRKQGAKMLGTCLHFLKGTPYIYQGEEIGMTNVSFPHISDYRDIETHNAYRDLVKTGKLSEEEFMRGVHIRGRDNARTPMQWNDSLNGGFSSGTPWIAVNPNYHEINATQAVNDEHSIFHYYRKLITYKKEQETLLYGRFEMVDRDHPHIFSYKRESEHETFLVLCNFHDSVQELSYEEDHWHRGEWVFGNSEPQSFSRTLEPFQAVVYRLPK